MKIRLLFLCPKNPFPTLFPTPQNLLDYSPHKKKGIAQHGTRSLAGMKKWDHHQDI